MGLALQILSCIVIGFDDSLCFNRVTRVGPWCPSADLFQPEVLVGLFCSTMVGTVSHVTKLRIQCVVGLGFAEIGQGEGWTRPVAVLGEINSSQLRESWSVDQFDFP